MTAAMEVIGRRFSANEIYVPEMLISARAMKEATAVLEPLLSAAGIRPEHTAVIGTVKGDLHDIGKNLVAMMWKGANIEVVDLGTNVPPEPLRGGREGARGSPRRDLRPADHHDGRHARRRGGRSGRPTSATSRSSWAGRR